MLGLMEENKSDAMTFNIIEIIITFIVGIQVGIAIMMVARMCPDKKGGADANI